MKTSLQSRGSAKPVRRQPAKKLADPFDVSDIASPLAEKALVAHLLPVFRNGTAPAELDHARKVLSSVSADMLTLPEAGDAIAAFAEAIEADPPTMADISKAAARRAAVVGGSARQIIGFITEVGCETASWRAAARLAEEAAAEIREHHAKRVYVAAVADSLQAIRDGQTIDQLVSRPLQQLEHVRDLASGRNSAARKLILTPVSEIEAKPINWLWPNRIIGGGLTIVTGPVGNTKSLFTIDVAARVTLGSRWPDGTGHAAKGSVILFGREDDPGQVIRPRVDAAGADLSRILLCEGTAGGKRDDEPAAMYLEHDIAQLRRALDDMPDCRLIVFDPLPDYIRADENSSAEVRAAIMPLQRLAQEKNVAVLAVLHQNKKNDLSAVQRIAGSAAFTQVARCVLSIGDHPEDKEGGLAKRRVMLVAKANNTERDVGQAYRLVPRAGSQVAIEWIDGLLNMSADELTRKPSGGRGADERRGDAVDALAELLAGGERRADEVKEIFEGMGLNRRQLDHAKRTLRIRPRQIITKEGRYWVWGLPAGEAAEADIQGKAHGPIPFDEWEG